MSFMPELIADRSGKWESNSLRFATEAEALDWVKDRHMRWTAVISTRVVESPDPVTHTWVDGKLGFLGGE